ncbi:MAG: amino acid kinase family protein [Promethearchaeota archaeon]|jgi:aspartokinase-like uncharacterized kinase
MDYKQAIFKIGGNILENSSHIESTISQLIKLFEENILHKILLLPGGGSYANFIRKIDAELDLGDDLSHWMAIYSMNYNGKFLNRKYPKLECIEDLKDFRDSNKILCIFLPYNFLHENDTLPHSWDVTSDSIAFYIAHQLHLKNCFLIKDIEGIYNMRGELIKEITTLKYSELKKSNKLAKIGLDQVKLKKSKPIDTYLLRLLDNSGISCYILNGSSNHQRIIEFFNTSVPIEKKVFTKIIKPMETNRYE